MACVRSGISGWVIGLLIRGRAGAERRAANPGRRCWPTARPAAVFYFGLGDRRWRALRRPPLAAAGRRAGLRMWLALWILASAERDRFLKSASEKGWPLTIALCVSRARARAAPRPAVSIRRRRRGAMGILRREPIETAGRGMAVACVRSGISGWVIGLLIRGRAGAERRAANPGRRCWPTARPAAVFYFGLGDRRWRSCSATAARSSWPEGGLRIWLALRILASADRDRFLKSARKRGGR